MAAMQSEPLPETVYVKVFMEGLRTGAVRTEVFRVHPSTFEEEISIAQNAEPIFKSDRLGWSGYSPSLRGQPLQVPRLFVIQNRWTSAILKMKVKRSFMLQRSDKK